MEERNEELYHHGVKGMKWGVRRNYSRDIYRKGKKVHSKGDSADRPGVGVKTTISRKSINSRKVKSDTPVSELKQYKNNQRAKKIVSGVATGVGVGALAIAAYPAIAVGAWFCKGVWTGNWD